MWLLFESIPPTWVIPGIRETYEFYLAVALAKAGDELVSLITREPATILSHRTNLSNWD